jgi:predicted lipid-binding transport protein (Tim44 family)
VVFLGALELGIGGGLDDFGSAAAGGTAGVVAVAGGGVGVGLIGILPASGVAALGIAGVAGVAGVVVWGAGARAIFTRVLCEAPDSGPQAAYAAAAAPKASSSVVPSTRAAKRRPGAPLLRLPGVAAPHCRHQSWSSLSGAPQLAQVR